MNDGEMAGRERSPPLTSGEIDVKLKSARRWVRHQLGGPPVSYTENLLTQLDAGRKRDLLLAAMGPGPDPDPDTVQTKLITDGGIAVSYRKDEAEGGEGWPRAKDDHFTFHASEGPWRVLMEGGEVEDVAMWAASGTPVCDVVVSLAAERDNGNDGAAALAYFESDAARALAAQILTAADAADRGDSFDPCTDTSDWRYLDTASQR